MNMPEKLHKKQTLTIEEKQFIKLEQSAKEIQSWKPPPPPTIPRPPPSPIKGLKYLSRTLAIL